MEGKERREVEVSVREPRREREGFKRNRIRFCTGVFSACSKVLSARLNKRSRPAVACQTYTMQCTVLCILCRRVI